MISLKEIQWFLILKSGYLHAEDVILYLIMVFKDLVILYIPHLENFSQKDSFPFKYVIKLIRMESVHSFYTLNCELYTQHNIVC